MITIQLTINLVWGKEPPRPFPLPAGTQAGQLLAALGNEKLQNDILVVVNKKVCPPEYTLQEGDAVTLLSVVSGG